MTPHSRDSIKQCLSLCSLHLSMARTTGAKEGSASKKKKAPNPPKQWSCPARMPSAGAPPHHPPAMPPRTWRSQEVRSKLEAAGVDVRRRSDERWLSMCAEIEKLCFRKHEAMDVAKEATGRGVSVLCATMRASPDA